MNVFTIGDGLWYWYATLVRDGRLLYSDLHLNLQPLFILLTRYSLTLFGNSWVGVRIFPAIQVILYSLGLLLVARHVPWRDRDRAVLILAAFGMTMTIQYYRFDDFHITTQIFQVYSLWLLLVLGRNPTARRTMVVAVGLGALCGLSIGNRLNDGTALLCACVIALFGSALRQRAMSVLLLCTVAAASFLGTVLLTGDKLAAWLHYSVVLASQIKGGSGPIWIYPLALPVKVLLRFAKAPHTLSPLVYSSGIIFGAVYGPTFLRRYSGRRRAVLQLTVSVVWIVCVVLFLKGVLLGAVNPTLSSLAVPLTYGLFLTVMVRFMAHLAGRAVFSPWHARELLLLIPMLQLFLAALTGGVGETETTPATALILLLLPIVTPVPFSPNMRRVLTLTAALVAVAAFPYKYLHPFQWHDYVANTMFVDRARYQHPIFGPMYVDRRQLATIEPICKDIAAEPGSGLLSMPYPHANYFCNMPPWRGYVQTWFDTSSKQTIDALAKQLQVAPPTWIYYERSLANIEAHEVVYNGGRALPHRQLDQLVMQRLAEGTWSVVHRECVGGADWLLIRTTPPRATEAVDSPVLMTKRLNLCSRTSVE